jgi:integrase
MAGRFAQRLIDSAKSPNKGQVLIRDGEVIGFALRVTANGCKTWVWDGRIRGQMRRITIGRHPDLSLNEARAEALKIRHDIAVGVDPWGQRFKEREEPTLSMLANIYIESHAKEHKRSWRDDEGRVRIHFRPLARFRLSAINREIVSRWHDAWQRIRLRAGLKGVRIHDLRRTCGSWLAESGHSLHLIGKVLNHSQPTTSAFMRDSVSVRSEKHLNEMPPR